MADHDRDAGSRGEEEAPRDPTPGDRPAAPPDAEAATTRVSGPPPGSGWATAAPPPPPPRSDSFRDFFRLKPTQIIGAGLIGLIIGGVLGGGAVAVISGMVHRGDTARVYWQDWERYPGYQDCRPGPYGSYCRRLPPYPGPYQVPATPYPLPTVVPTMMPPSVMPTPMPTKTG
ncbi:hypothetical protein [Nonomuraea aurantiaca]|uniref:hypothetical protein n=1 Tax=Nonomuraea aurantiaca TaxID=2878562 RepID=UPI001CDA3625|nr:hypothetical protein [Nonomuraea aurantiaca]MCA2221317.1 hypothetical protein [Nonomuraea aurantiaca]